MLGSPLMIADKPLESELICKMEIHHHSPPRAAVMIKGAAVSRFGKL